MIVYQDNSPLTNTLKVRGRDGIYLWTLNDLQDGHEVLDLMTGRVVLRPKVDPVVMTRGDASGKR